jgi:hypothetical protein
MNVPHDLIRSLEIEADRLALDRLFGGTLARSGDARARADRLVGFETTLTALGAALVPMLFHALRVFSQRQDEAATHPPLWFRGDEVLRAQENAHVTPQDLTAPEAVRLQRDQRGFQVTGEVARTLASIAEIHPLLGEWLGASIAGDREAAAEAVLAEARNAQSRGMGAVTRTRHWPVGW